MTSNIVKLAFLTRKREEKASSGGGEKREMQRPGSSLSRLSSKEGWKSVSRRWDKGGKRRGKSYDQIEGIYGAGSNETCGYGMRKRVLVLVDHSSNSKQAMMWALTHVANRGDILTLLQIAPSSCRASEDTFSSYVANSLGALCKACKPEVEVEALVIQGPKMATVISQVKKLEVSVLVLGQKKPSSILRLSCLRSSTDEFVEQCINTLDCLTIGVRKKSSGVGGYLISTRWHKNFWLLA